MKSSCVEREQIFALAQQMLSGRDREKVSAHVNHCEACRKVFLAYQHIDSVLGEWTPTAEPSPWFDARVRAAVAELEPAPRPRSFLGLGWSRWLAAPALASLLVVAGLIVLRYERPPVVMSPKTVLSNPQTGNAPVVASARANPGANPKTSPVTATRVKTTPASQELKMYQNMPVLEDYDMLAEFDVISALPKGSHKVVD